MNIPEMDTRIDNLVSPLQILLEYVFGIVKTLYAFLLIYVSLVLKNDDTHNTDNGTITANDVHDSEKGISNTSATVNDDGDFNLARLYLRHRKYELAVHYFLIAAEKGNSTALKVLGYLYRR
jgi:TPR repeat protein